MIFDEFSLTGKVALVTGSATGLGQAMSIALAEAGADIAGVSHEHSPDSLERNVKQLGRQFAGIRADLENTAKVGYIVDSAVEAFGKVDILVNNAGIIRRAPAVDFMEEDWDSVINVNLKSLYFLCQAAARRYIRQGSGGKIINIASMLSFQGGILVAPYTASKSAVRGLTQLLANEWAAKGINVNAIAPGYMETSNTEALRRDPTRSEAILARIPAGRWGVPDDLRGAVVFLASPASSYVHGYTMAVDGGWLGR